MLLLVGSEQTVLLNLSGALFIPKTHHVDHTNANKEMSKYCLMGISFAGNELGPEGASFIASALHDHPTVADLKYVGLSSCSVSQQNQLTLNHPKPYSLCANSVQPTGARAVADLLARNSKIRILE